MFKKITVWKLRWLARLIISKYRPKIVGITGTVGKSSAKEALATVLDSKFRVRRSMANYNNEIGIPLTVIGAASGGHSFVRWLGVFIQAMSLILFRDRKFPEILVLEMAVDHPGDMDYLLSIAVPDVAVVTALDKDMPVHLEFFRNADQLVREKMKMVQKLSPEKLAVLNADDKVIMSWSKKIRANALTFGRSEKADMRVLNVVTSKRLLFGAQKGVTGVSFKLSYKGSTVPVLLPAVLGAHQAQAGAAAAVVGLHFGLNLLQISEALQQYSPPPGRMRILSGIKHSLIIDDSYNSAPMAMQAALETLMGVEVEGRKIACLGSMAELGSKTKQAHQKMGRLAAGVADILITVGEEAHMIADTARKEGMSADRIFEFVDSVRAGRFVQNRLQEGDVLLVKGSQRMRMEKIVKEVMADPLRAGELLVRQDDMWQER